MGLFYWLKRPTNRTEHDFTFGPDLMAGSKASSNLAEHHRRLREMREAWQAYYGFYENPLDVQPGEADPNVKINFARLIVNKGVSFLFGQPVRFDIDAARRTELEAWLDAFWRYNRRGQLLQKAGLNGGVTGHQAVKIVPARPSRGERYPSLRAVNPQMLTVFFNPDDIEEVEEYRLEWDYTEVEGGRLRTVYRRQRHVNEGERWRIVDQRSYNGAGPWTDMQETPWPFPFSAVVDCQNLPNPNDYYGCPDLEPDILQLINRLNFVASNWSKIIRLHAHPRQWAKGFDPDELRVAVDETLVIPNEEGEVGLLEMKSEMVSTDMLYRHIKEALHEVARVPEVAVGKVETVGNLSGVALAILYQPLVELTWAKRETYGPWLEEINRRGLWVAGKGRDVEVKNQWPELMPADPKAQREIANMDVNVLRISSRETAAVKLGHDWEQEAQRMEREWKEDVGRSFTIKEKEAEISGRSEQDEQPEAGSSSGGGTGSDGAR